MSLRSSAWPLLLALAAGACGGRSALYPGPVVSSDASADALETGPASGRCPSGLSPCGSGQSPNCQDLSQAQDHCGACGHGCPPGIACRSGRCQQYRCKGALGFRALPITKTWLEDDYQTNETRPNYRPSLADFDGDGSLDLVGMPERHAPMSLLYGAGDGSFPVQQPIDETGAWSWEAAAADLDGDGHVDLASIRADAGGPRGPTGAVTVRRGSGDRSVPVTGAVALAAEGQPQLFGLLLADLDSDGHLDLLASGATALEHWHGLGAAGFEHRPPLPASAATVCRQLTDWNGDVFPDLVCGGGTLSLRMGRGDGSFDPEINCGLALDGTSFAATSFVGDLDHDGRIDMVVHRTGILLGMDGCNASKIVPVAGWAKEYGNNVALVDLNGDDNLDILASAINRGGHAVHVGNGKGDFAQPLPLPDLESPSSAQFLVGDLNRDTKLDVVLFGTEGWRVLLNTCP